MSDKERVEGLFNKLYDKVKPHIHAFTKKDMIEFALLATDPLKDE